MRNLQLFVRPNPNIVSADATTNYTNSFKRYTTTPNEKFSRKKKRIFGIKFLLQ